MLIHIATLKEKQIVSGMAKRFIYIFLLLTQSGCGLISIGYNYAPAYLRYSINSYMSYNDQQKEVIRKEVDVYMAWHRKSMLPAYVEYLQGIQKVVQAEAPLKVDDVRRFRTEARALYVKTMLPAVSPAAMLLASLDAEQVEELTLSFAKEINKIRSKELNGSLEQQLRARTERSIDFIENLTGGLTDKQLQQLRELNNKLPFATPAYLAQRENNQNKLIELLKIKPNEPATAIATALSSWIVTPELNRSPEDQSVIQAFESGSDEMIVTVYQTLTERQKKTLLKSIAKYINTFQELATAN